MTGFIYSIQTDGSTKFEEGGGLQKGGKRGVARVFNGNDYQ